MATKDDNKEYCLQAMKVDFLTEQWEREQYAAAIKSATLWGEKIEQQQKEYKRRNHLIDKYNV